MRFLFVDQILEFEKGKSATGAKVVTMSEDFLADHFPRFPVMPGVLQLEAISQVASWLAFVSSGFKMKGTLAELGTIKFKDFVKPGDQMIIEVSFQSSDNEGVTFKANVKVKDKLKTTLTSARLSYIPVEELEDPLEAQEYFDYLSGEKPFGAYLR
jgi:3-hydroxyacyl-[acyl-carrier-protein] dehydratase